MRGVIPAPAWRSPPDDSTRWWQWPTVLSLDAPAVTCLWQWLFAAIAGVRIGWPEYTVVAVSVWLAYVGDRWFEGWRLDPGSIRTARHRFYHQWRWPIAAISAVVFAADVMIAFLRLSHREFLAGAILLGPTLLYVLSHQLIHRDRRWRAPKELCIAVLLAGGASVFVLASPGVSLRVLWAPIALFAALCFSNVALIAGWELDVDTIHGQESLARRFQAGRLVSRILPLVLVACAAALTSHLPGYGRVAAHCAAASALLLVLVDRFESRIGRQLARVLADVVLLTPLLPLLRGLAS